MIQPKARESLTPGDFQFVSTTLGRDQREAEAVMRLLTSRDDRDRLLDAPQLFERVMTEDGFSKISLFLYFYILLRRALQEFTIDSRDVADYLATMLAEFSRGKRLYMISPQHQKQFKYLVDLLNALLDANTEDVFFIHSHVGNYSMFLSGVFPDYVYHRANVGRAGPDFSYYEKMGSASYRSAAQSAVARRMELESILETLAERFKPIRLALNYMVDNYLNLDETPQGTTRAYRRLQDFIDDRRRSL